MPHKLPQRPDPWANDRIQRADNRTRLTSPDEFFAPPQRAQTGHALQSPVSKLGAVILLMAISSVAALGMFMPDEEKSFAPLLGAAPQAQELPNNAQQQAFALAYELAKARVESVSGLTRPQRIATAREALARLQGGDVTALTPQDILALAKRAPESVKKAAFQGVGKGEAMGISVQSQLLIERMLHREKHSSREPIAP